MTTDDQATTDAAVCALAEQLDRSPYADITEAPTRAAVKGPEAALPCWMCGQPIGHGYILTLRISDVRTGSDVRIPLCWPDFRQVDRVIGVRKEPAP